MPDRNLNVRITGDAASLLRAFQQSGQSAEQFAKRMDASNRSLAAHRKATADSRRETDRLGASMKGAIQPAHLLQSTIGQLKMPALITGAGIAAQGVSTLAAGVGGLAAALAPLSGAIAAYPALGSAAAQGMGVFKLATNNIFKAVGGLNEQLDKNTKAFKALTPEAKKVAVQLDEMKKPLVELSGVAQENMFPGLFAGLKDAEKNLPILRSIVGDTGRSLGDLAKQAGDLIGSKSFGRDLATQGARNATSIERLGSAALHVGDALRHVTLAAGPLVDWMTKTGLRFAEVIDKQARLARGSGELTSFFEKTRVTMEQVGKLAGNVAVGLFNIIKAGQPLGTSLLGNLVKVTKTFREWTSSANGQNKIARYFEQAKPGIMELGRLIGAVGGAFLRLGQGSQVAPLLRTIRTQVVPAFESLINNTTKALGPSFMHMLGEVAKFFSTIGGTSGPLQNLVHMLDTALTLVNTLVKNIPGLGTALSTVVAAGGLVKALQITAAITGVSRLRAGLRGVATEQAAVAAVTARGAGAGAVMGGGVARSTGGRIGAGAIARGVGAAGLAAVGGPLGLAAAGGLIFGPSIVSAAVKPFKSENESAASREIQSMTGRLKALSVAANIPGLKKLASDARSVEAAFRWAHQDKTADQIRKIGKAASAASQGPRELRSQFQRMRNGSITNITDLRKNVAYNTGLIRSGMAGDSQHAADAMTRNFGAGIKAVKLGMHDGSISVKDGMKEIRRLTRDNMSLARTSMADLSADGRKKLAQNFRDAASAVRTQMKAGEVSTRNGMRQIHSLLAKELQVYGFSISEARNIAKGNRYDGGPNEGAPQAAMRAAGGWIGNRGQIGTDVVPAMLAPGEAVLNRHQQAVVEGMLGDGFLDALFTKVQKPHYLAKGGRAKDGVQKFAYGGVAAPVARLISRLDSMGFQHGSTTGGGHAPHSYHYRGQAVDYGNAANNLSRLWSVVYPQRASFAELFGPPGLYHGTSRFFDSALQAQHMNHIHMALTGRMGALGAPKSIRAPVIRGGGAVGRAVQGALGMATGAANRVLSRAVRSTAFEVDASGPSGGSSSRNMAIGRQLAAARGWTGPQWNALRALWQGESGWRTNADNPTSDAYGIPQALPGSKMASAGADWRTNPATQIKWGLGYIAGRYGSPVSALSAWQSRRPHWYARGGRVPGFAKGKKGKPNRWGANPFKRPRPIGTNPVKRPPGWSGAFKGTELEGIQAEIAMAALTETLADDIAGAQHLETYWQGQYRAAKRSRNPVRIAQAAGELASARSSLTDLRTTTPPDAGGDFGGDPNQPLIDAMAALTEAQNAAAELERQRIDLEKQNVANQNKLIVMQNTQGPQLLASVIAAVSGGIGGKVGLGYQSVGVAGQVART